jgi:hypothetical protein
MFVKSTRLAKSTGWLGAVSVTAAPLVGTRLAELIVTKNDCTSQLGWSVPKATSDPVGTLAVAVVLPPPPPLHPTIRTVARPATTAGKTIRFRLLIPILLESLRILPNRERFGSYFRSSVEPWHMSPLTNYVLVKN